MSCPDCLLLNLKVHWHLQRKKNPLLKEFTGIFKVTPDIHWLASTLFPISHQHYSNVSAQGQIQDKEGMGCKVVPSVYEQPSQTSKSDPSIVPSVFADIWLTVALSVAVLVQKLTHHAESTIFMEILQKHSPIMYESSVPPPNKFSWIGPWMLYPYPNSFSLIIPLRS